MIFVIDATPYISFSILGNDGLVRLLLSNGASVNASSSEGTPLHMAASHGKSAIVQVLLQNNADVSILIFDICTIIMLFMGTDIFS
jgi:ankyrin repeat protein